MAVFRRVGENDNARPWNIKSSPFKKKSTDKTTLYPLFENCAYLHKNDAALYKIFMDCSNGKFPPGFSFKDGIIYYKHGKIKRQEELDNDLTKASLKIITFLKLYHGESNVIDTSMTNNTFSYKKEIKKKIRLKDDLINIFISDVLTKKYMLTSAEQIVCRRLITIAFYADILCFEDILFDENDQFITMINGIDMTKFNDTRLLSFTSSVRITPPIKRVRKIKK